MRMGRSVSSWCVTAGGTAGDRPRFIRRSGAHPEATSGNPGGTARNLQNLAAEAPPWRPTKVTLGGSADEQRRAMDKVTVHHFRVWDHQTGRSVMSRMKRTAYGIAFINGKIVPGTDEEVELSALDGYGRYTPPDTAA